MPDLGSPASARGGSATFHTFDVCADYVCAMYVRCMCDVCAMYVRCMRGMYVRCMRGMYVRCMCGDVCAMYERVQEIIES